MSTDIPLACTLSSSELPRRVAFAQRLGRDALQMVDVNGTRALLGFAGERERVEALVAAEHSYCSFMEFTVRERAGLVELEIVAPGGGGEWPLRGLVAAVVSGWMEAPGTLNHPTSDT